MNYMHPNDHLARRQRLWGAQPVAIDVPAPTPRQRDFLYVQMDPFEESITVTKAAWRAIATEVCAKHGVSITDVRGDRRARPIAIARHELCYRLAIETGMSMAEIGRKLGNRDPSTIVYAIMKHEQRNGLAHWRLAK